MSKTLYEILDILESATPTEIKDAYRRLAMKWHPDRNPSNKQEAEARFKEIAYAYKVLSDRINRAEYDEWLKEERKGAAEISVPDDQHDDSGATEEAAAQLFFEQMLDLATELGSRGFSEPMILKTLLGLDCPEPIARAVSAHAVRLAASQRAGVRTPNSETERSAPKKSQPTSIKSMPWEEAEPYYANVIGGVYAKDRMDDALFQNNMAVYHRQMKGYTISFLVMIVGAIVSAVAIPFSKGGSSIFFVILASTIGSISFIGFLGVLIWRIASSSAAFRRERAMRYYLNAFQCYHNSSPLAYTYTTENAWPWVFSIFWLSYRRMPGCCLIGVAVVAAIGSTEMLVGLNKPELGGISNTIGYGVGVIMGMSANRIYFYSACNKIKKFLALPREQALTRLIDVGGVNRWSWVGFVALFLVLCIPAALITSEEERARAAQFEARIKAETQVVAEAAAQKARAEADARARAEEQTAEMQRFKSVIAEMEARYPELNSRNPRFNQNLVDDANLRVEHYIKEGNTPSNALRVNVHPPAQ